MDDTQVPARVREALERTAVMALSTIDEDGGPWTSPVQYQADSQLNLYFASMPYARHVRNIQRDPRVAVAIYHMPGPPGGNLGLQIRGSAAQESAAAATAGSCSRSSQLKPGASTRASTVIATASNCPTSETPVSKPTDPDNSRED